MIVGNLIAYTFAGLIVLTAVGTILSFIFHQATFLHESWFRPEPVSLRSMASPWSRRILDETAIRPFQEALRVCERDPALA